MKKLIAIAVAVMMVITLFAVVAPVSAGDDGDEVVFEASVVPGAFNTDEIDKGEVKVYADGGFDIKIEGAPGYKTYYVVVGQWVEFDGHGKIKWYLNESWTLTTDEEGEGEFHGDAGTLPSGNWSLFNLADHLGAGGNQFVSGFEVEEL